MDHLLFVWQMNLCVNLQLLLAVKPFGALPAKEGPFLRLRMLLLHMIVQRLLMGVDFVALIAAGGRDGGKSFRVLCLWNFKTSNRKSIRNFKRHLLADQNVLKLKLRNHADRKKLFN